MTGRIIRQWSTWAQSHRRRYHATRRAPGMLALTLRRAMTGSVRNEHHHRVTLLWAPRVKLHVGFAQVSRIHELRGWRRPSPDVARSAPGSFAVSQVLAAGPARNRRNRREQGQSHEPDRTTMDFEMRQSADLRTPLQRVFARTSRFGIPPGRGSTTRATSKPARMTVRVGKRVEAGGSGLVRVLHSPRHERAAAPPVESDVRTVMSPQAPAMRGSLEPAVMSESGMNLLTERVIRQIDRRIVAYRERLGRSA